MYTPFPHPLGEGAQTANTELVASGSVSKGEQGDAGGYATTEISSTSTSRSMSGCQRLHMALSSLFGVPTRVAQFLAVCSGVTVWCAAPNAGAKSFNSL